MKTGCWGDKTVEVGGGWTNLPNYQITKA